MVIIIFLYYDNDDNKLLSRTATHSKGTIIRLVEENLIGLILVKHDDILSILVQC